MAFPRVLSLQIPKGHQAASISRGCISSSGGRFRPRPIFQAPVHWYSSGQGPSVILVKAMSRPARCLLFRHRKRDEINSVREGKSPSLNCRQTGLFIYKDLLP